MVKFKFNNRFRQVIIHSKLASKFLTLFCIYNIQTSHLEKMIELKICNCLQCTSLIRKEAMTTSNRERMWRRERNKHVGKGFCCDLGFICIC